MRLIGLTGGYASGKSIALKEFAVLGCQVMDADHIARDVTLPGQPAYEEIIAEFGSEVLNRDETINRARLGEIAFADPGKMERLAAITHPRIYERMMSRIREIYLSSPSSDLVIEIALLIEIKLYEQMDKVIVVYCDEDQQLCRAMQRDGLSEEEAMVRLGRQMPIKEKLKYADFVIYNTGDIRELKEQVKSIYALIRAEEIEE